MKKLKQILLTFDYELFLGENSGSVDNCIIKPTNNILKILSEHNFYAIFFIDATYLHFLNEKSKQSSLACDDYHKIKSQIKEIIKLNHEIYLHIHPHWIDATYNNTDNTWNLSNTQKFSFSNLSENEKDDIFSKSILELYSIINEVKPDYIIEGFRAGGLCIQPFTDFSLYFKKYKIKYEFSVCKELMLKKNSYGFNFFNAPEDAIYKFSDNILIKDSNGHFTEFTISKIKIPFIIKFPNGILYRLNKKISKKQKVGDGKGTSPRIVEKKQSIKSKFSNYEMASIEVMNNIKIYAYKMYIRNNTYMHFISHPKLIHKQSLESFSNFLHHLKKKYIIDQDYKKWL